MNWRRWVSVDELREGFGGGAEDDFVKGVDVERLLGADVDGADAALVGYVDEAGGGIDGAGGAYDEQRCRAIEFAVDAVHVKRDFAEPDDVRAERGVAGFAGGEVVGVFVEGVIGEVFVGTSAAGLEEAAVHVVDTVRAGALVEIVDVLSTEVETVAKVSLD